MSTKQTSDKKLMEIATDVGNGDHAMSLALALGLSAAEANNTGLDCYKVLLKARNAMGGKDQKDKLRAGLIESGHRATADKLLRLCNPRSKKAVSKTEFTPSRPKRTIKDAPLDEPPTAKKRKSRPKLEEEENELKEIEKELKDLKKKKTEVEKQIDKKTKEETKKSSVVKKLLEQQHEKTEKLAAKQKEHLNKYDSSKRTSKNPPCGTDS